MKNNKQKFAQEWLKKANEDEKAGKIILKEGGLYGLASFHFQQMAEKYLKGYLILKGKRFRKIHDLTEILKECREMDKSFKDLTENCEFLNPFYIASRYPGDIPEGISKNESEEAYKKARGIKEFVFKKVKDKKDKN